MSASIATSLVGESAPMRRLRSLIDVAAPTRLPVLIEGPTGAGKELVAAALHAASGRRGAFVPFNVCAIGDSMFEDALFGHVRGAFTGAVSDTPGFLREADGGTALFDEISGLHPSMQAKLLRAVELGVFRPVGARHDVRSAFRLVAATNERLETLVDAGRFRADLAHRLRGLTLHVPALADRVDDVPVLVRHFLDRAGHAAIVVVPNAMALLQQYDWPGNVRELRQVVEWSAALSGAALTSESVASVLGERRRAPPSPAVSHGGFVVRHQLLETLERHAWNTEAAAQELRIHRATLYRRMKRLQLTVPPDRAGVRRAV